jgi:phospholipid/cholesterol/gamma-HCH transport system substrate-binding protein
MEVDQKAAARRAVLAIAFVVLLGGLVVAYLFSSTQVSVPLLKQSRTYQVSVVIPDVDNLVAAGKVEIAGVVAGEVRSLDPRPDGVLVTFGLDKVAAPLHEGARVRMGERSLVGETYLDVTDGTGPPLPSKATLPTSAVQPSVQLHDVLASLDAGTRQQLSQMLRSLGGGTEGTKSDVNALMTGFGSLGREGHTAADAIASQSKDLDALVRETSVLMDSLDTGQGQIADLVTQADRITKSTGGQRPAIEASVRELPGVLDSADKATTELTDLSGSLAPVASKLNEASPDLSAALEHLPGTSKDLRGLVSPLDDTLKRAPDTLRVVPEFGEDTRGLIPPTRRILQEANPMLSYLKPYGPDVAGFISNFDAALGYRAEDGVSYLPLMVLGNEQEVEPPADLSVNTYANPYPVAGKGGLPGPFNSKYPRIERESK